jgi:hypothetical protein
MVAAAPSARKRHSRWEEMRFTREMNADDIKKLRSREL